MFAKSMTARTMLVLASFAIAQRTMAQSTDTAVVVSAGNPTTDIRFADLRKMFAGAKRTWPDGQAIKLVTRGPGSLERLALLRLLSMSESAYKQYWTAQVFRGEADAEPLVVPSAGMQKEALVAFPGAISLVNFREVKAGMKVIKVDGLMPGSPGYPLH